MIQRKMTIQADIVRMQIPNHKDAVKPRTRQEQIADRLANIPESNRKTYQKAVGGRNRAAAVKAFCQECVGYERAEITACTDLGCSLYPYRPYRTARMPQNVTGERFSPPEST